MVNEEINQRDTTDEALHYAESGFIVLPEQEAAIDSSTLRQWQELTMQLAESEDGREFFRAFLRELV
jgi:hypothetical protein